MKPKARSSPPACTMHGELAALISRHRKSLVTQVGADATGPSHNHASKVRSRDVQIRRCDLFMSSVPFTIGAAEERYLAAPRVPGKLSKGVT